MIQFCYLRPYLGIETASCRMLAQTARMDMDWNLKKLGQLFQVFNALTTKITKNYYGL